DAAMADPAGMQAWLIELGAAAPARPAPAGDRPLREVQVLRGRMDTLLEKARALGLLEDRELSALAARAAHLLYTGPIDLVAAAAVGTYRGHVARHDQGKEGGEGGDVRPRRERAHRRRLVPALGARGRADRGAGADAPVHRHGSAARPAAVVRAAAARADGPP